MTSYILLALIIAVLGVISYFMFKKDILSPSFISCFMFEVCTIFSIIGLYSWNNVMIISANTIAIITFGLIAFILGEYTLRKCTAKKETNYGKNERYIQVKKYMNLIMYVFVILTIILTVAELYRICEHYGNNTRNISEMLNFYRHKSVLYEDVLTRDNTDINFFVKQMHKVCVVICVINIYIFINNLFYEKKEKRMVNNLVQIPLILLCFMESLLTSGRALLMHYFICILFLLVFYLKKRLKIADIKIAFISLVCLIGMALLFYVIAPIVGRGTSNGIIEYISFYFGTTIPSLNKFIEQIPEHSNYIGEETFSGVYLLLNKLHIINYTRNTAYGWQVFANGAGSNVYTAFRAYYFDFGIIGLCLCQFLFGFLFSGFYKIKEKNDFYMLLYTYYFYILIEQIRAEQFFAIISSTTFAYLILFFVISKILFTDSEGERISEKECMTLREIQLEELEILKKTAKYLDNNNLKYFLCGGTLLGAVRHRGFIPWDDDIDIMMPRNDYDKLIDTLNENSIDPNYELKCIERRNSIYPFAKIINKNIIIQSKSIEDKNLWIDIFPIDGYPEDNDEAIKVAKKIALYKGIIYLQTTSFKEILDENKGNINKTKKIILKPIASIIPTIIVSKLMVKIATKYNYENSKFVGAYIWGYGIKEKQEKEKFVSKQITVQFENENFKAPIGYDTYLSSIYGNYMKLPSKEKRITHNIFAKKIKT